ncbi:hypothetical protein [Paenibacillus sp. IHBB 10380]|uniref:hypothetical protein n=1 Tax=Paenibacillus sp. IHBB 10380 TaxID=1566358 RepID=UPI0005CFC437|nr:hypothetical protein [Paenibacillus sp. IHBB 10380]AJS58276.1 hypothetical protein UB51_06950 [Paenibacillus sp. IHBB 10380]
MACGPSTGAMIANYYKSKGYNIRGSSYYGSDAKLVNHLYSEMNSGMWGTTLTNFASGLFTHLRHNDSPTIWRGLAYSDSTAHFVEYKDAIYTDRPVTIRYDYFTNNPEDINYHFVVGMAYKAVNGSDYFGIKDPDGGPNNTSTNYYSWSSHSGDFAMHLTIPQY